MEIVDADGTQSFSAIDPSSRLMRWIVLCRLHTTSTVRRGGGNWNGIFRERMFFFHVANRRRRNESNTLTTGDFRCNDDQSKPFFWALETSFALACAGVISDNPISSSSFSMRIDGSTLVSDCSFPLWIAILDGLCSWVAALWFWNRIRLFLFSSMLFWHCTGLAVWWLLGLMTA